MQQILYAVLPPEPKKVNLNTLAETKEGAILKAVIHFGQSWDEIESNGWECVRVEITNS